MSRKNSVSGFSPDQLDRMVARRVERAERAALKSIFQQQGLDSAKVEQAIADYYRIRQKRCETAAQLLQQLDQTGREVRRLGTERQVMLEAIRRGLDKKAIPYIVRLVDIDLLAETKNDMTREIAVKAAVEKLLSDIPGLRPMTLQGPGFHLIGAGR